MEAWSYFHDAKGVFFANETDPPTGSIAKSRKFMVGWDQKPFDDMENDGLVLEFADKGIFETARNPLGSKSDEYNAEPPRKVYSSCLSASNLLSEQKDSSERFSSLPHQESSSMDLKLSRPIDYRNSQNDDNGDGKPDIASALATKKSRAISSCSQKPLCQVYGCNMDLSSSKDYHKRHRVCEVHSKTAKVVVNGVEQRFCQQCSRFHLLGEFDDGKRSCRRRLAGHNERRRKPSFYFLTGRRHKFLHSSQGNKFLEASSAKNDISFVSPEAYPSTFLYKVRDEQDGQRSRLVKFEDESTYCPHPAIFPTNGDGNDRSCPKTSSEATVVSSVQESYGVSCSNRALSLLSSQSQRIFGTPNASFSITQANGNVGPTKDIPEEVHSSRVIPIHEDQIEPLLINPGKTEAFFHESSFLNPRSCFSQEKGPSTVDLFQLSSHLQRVEQQRNSIQVKQESNEPCYFGGN